MIEINNTTKQKINLKQTRKIIEEFLLVYHRSGQGVSLALVGASSIRRLNRQYRKQDQSTDVLSFSGADLYSKDSLAYLPKILGEVFLGEVIINSSEIKKFSKYQEMFAEIEVTERRKTNSSNYIFYFLLVHGLLHLITYNDNTPNSRLKMLKLGRDFLEKIL